jgi:hypothetical protein
MLKKETKGGKVPQPGVGAEAEEIRWLIGKCLLNGGNKLKPELQGLLDSLQVVTKVVTDHCPEPMVCIKGPKETIIALIAIAKGKVV